MIGIFKSVSGAVSLGAMLALAARAEFKVVGYLPAWAGAAAIQGVQYKKLTHVIWAFAYPADDGSLSGFEGENLKKLVTAAHAEKVKVFLAVGGGAHGDKGWSVATSTDAGRRALIKSCMDAVRTYNLDGIDFDWEYPEGPEVAGFNASVKMLAAALHAEGKQLSSAVTYNDWPRSFPTGELFASFDFLNIMVYDNPPPHATVAHVNTSLDLWIRAKGLPKEKFILGCPFYGPGGKYKDIVAANPAAAMVDQEGAEGYNSIPTIRKKTAIGLAKAGGMMFWELSQDATGGLSLLSAAHEVIVKQGPTGVLGIGPAVRRSATGVFRSGPGISYGVLAGRGLPMLRFDPAGRLMGPVSGRPGLPGH